MRDVWWSLLVKEDLLTEVWRKANVEDWLGLSEYIDENNLDEHHRKILATSLKQANSDALAASLGVFPGDPDYERWVQPDIDKEDRNGGAAK
jgi:hypothetical protein